jgi:TonB family protein
VTHAISATYSRFDRMSPTAAALALLLHCATALALWWVSPLNHADPEEDAIDVTIERPQPAPPPAPQPKVAPPVAATPAPAPAPAAKLNPPPQKGVSTPLGVPPPSPNTADTSKQVPKVEPQKPQLPQLPEVEPQQQAPQPQQEQPQQQQQQQQAMTPKESLAPPPPSPPLEKALPPLEAPPPPLTSKDFPKPLPPPAPPPAHPQAHVAPPVQQPQLRPSPLSTLQRKQAPADSQATAPSATFINPADQYSQTQLIEQYLYKVAAKISQYRYRSNQANEQGTAVLRLVMARDGRLLDVSIARSSGIIALDRGLIEAARAAAPYAPFPSGIPGPQVAFTLPFASVYRPQ